MVQYSSRKSFESEGAGKIALSGISMKFLVMAFVAQTWVVAGSKDCGRPVMAYGSRPSFRGGPFGWVKLLFGN